MIEINQLTKVGDILNSEGMILGLFKNNSGDMFLSSHLTDGSGDVYYTTKKDVLILPKLVDISTVWCYTICVVCVIIQHFYKPNCTVNRAERKLKWHIIQNW